MLSLLPLDVILLYLEWQHERRSRELKKLPLSSLANLSIQAQDIRHITYVFSVNQTTNDKEITPYSSLKPLIMRSCSLILFDHVEP